MLETIRQFEIPQEEKEQLEQGVRQLSQPGAVVSPAVNVLNLGTAMGWQKERMSRFLIFIQDATKELDPRRLEYVGKRMQGFSRDLDKSLKPEYFTPQGKETIEDRQKVAYDARERLLDALMNDKAILAHMDNYRQVISSGSHESSNSAREKMASLLREKYSNELLPSGWKDEVAAQRRFNGLASFLITHRDMLHAVVLGDAKHLLANLAEQPLELAA